MYFDWRGWAPRPTVGALRAAAQRERARLEKQGRTLAPVAIEGRTIARTFWGRAWCTHLERYSDFENRLPRGRSYVCNGLVVHLEIAGGRVEALVRGTELYEVKIDVQPVTKTRWRAICRDSAGAIDSLVELLQGRFSAGVMERLCRQDGGLFPTPKEMTFACSCPDWASMCKHVAAVLYGVGARLDTLPELLFRLREVDANDLIASAAGGARLATRAPAKDKVLAGADLSEMFGLQMGGDEGNATVGAGGPRKAGRRKRETPGPKTTRETRGKRAEDGGKAGTEGTAAPTRRGGKRSASKRAGARSAAGRPQGVGAKRRASERQSTRRSKS